jgi:hypothetical protein
MLFKELVEGDVFIFLEEIYQPPVTVFQIQNGMVKSYPLGHNANPKNMFLANSEEVILLYVDKNEL